MIKRAVAEVGTYFYFLPSYTQGKKVIWDNIDNDGFKMLDHIPPEILKDKNTSELKIELINGSIIQLIGADTFEKTSVGTNPRGVVFSEFSINDPVAWEYVRPILKVNGGWAIFNFTPRGKNHGWKILQIAKENNWFWEVLTIEDTHVLTKDDIEQEIREGMPRELAEQEFYCKFIDGASSVFRRVDENVYEGYEGLHQNKRYQIGIDLAKYQDYTVISVVDLHTFHLVKQMKFNKMDWSQQKEIIVKEIKYWNKARSFVDSTGVGDPIVEDLKKLVPSVEAFHFTEISRTQLLNNLQVMLEQDKLKIPNDPELIDELKSFNYELVGMKVKMMVPEGLHDDRVMSLGLACWGLSERLPLNITNKVRRDKKKEVQGIKVRMTSY